MGTNSARQRGPHKLPKTLGSFSSIPQFRMELDRLARLPASPHSSTTGTPSFLTEEGIAQIAINLLSQRLVVKYGERGVMAIMQGSRQTEWASEGSNIRGRYTVPGGSGNGDIIVL